MSNYYIYLFLIPFAYLLLLENTSWVMDVNILIIEDDLILAENLRENLQELEYKNIEIANNFQGAKKYFASNTPDLCLVDIKLENSTKDGIEIMKVLDVPGKLPFIYLTSFDDDHIRTIAKETNPSAYLIKPASKKQLDVAIDFAISQFAKSHQEKMDVDRDRHPLFSGPGFYFLKTGDKYEKINIEDIIYLKAAGAYCDIFGVTRKYTVTANLKSILQQLSDPSMVRSHRSFAVNIHHIHAFDDMSIDIAINGKRKSIPISQKYKEEVMNSLPRLKAD